jgi:hypothetical protein
MLFDKVEVDRHPIAFSDRPPGSTCEHGIHFIPD